jgi:2-polyprenyl-3-methyl-5-hydroxy-6-metoxy-1,4-benzoquinol methylase
MRQLLKPNGVLVVGHITRTPRAWVYHILLSQKIIKRVPFQGFSWRPFHTPKQLQALALAAGLQHLGTDLLRYSVNGMRWKSTSNRHLATRYLSTFKPLP